MSFFNVFYRNSTRHWLYEFNVDGVEHNYWGGAKTGETIEIEGKTYTSIAIKHSQIKISDDIEKAEFTITLPFDSELAQNEWRGNERSITFVKIIKFQDGIKKYRAQGRLYDVTYNDDTFDLVFNQGIAENEIKGNHLLYQKSCPYAVFSEMCGLDRDAWKVKTTIKSVDGLTVTVRDAAGFDDGYFDLGMIWHENLARSESIDVQVGNQLTLIRRFDSLADLIVSDEDLLTMDEAEIPYVYTLPGCLGGVVICSEKFDNIPNYGGQPFTPDEDPSGKSSV